jgi:hypothetical protein
MDEKYVEERAAKITEAKMKSLDGYLHGLALDLQRMVKMMEHAAVRFTVLQSLDKQIEMLEADYKVTKDVVFKCLHETGNHLQRVVNEKQAQIDTPKEEPQPQPSSPRKRGMQSSRASKSSIPTI